MSENKKVLIFSPYAGPWAWRLHNQVDAVVASALRLRGCEVLVIGCDGVYQDCYIFRGNSGSRRDELCQSCSRAGQEYFEEAFNLPYLQLRNFIEADDYTLAYQWIETVNPENYANALYQNLPIGKWVTSSIYTYFRISARSLYRPDVRKVHRQYLIEGLVTYNAVSRLSEAYKPTSLFIFNARLAPYRIAFEVARQHQVDVIVQELGLIDDTYRLFDNDTCLSAKQPLNFVKAWEQIPLTQSELLEVKHYFTDREAGRNMNSYAFYKYKTEYVNVRRQLKIPADAKIFTVFTSSEDELAMDEAFAGATEQLNIIDRLIEIFANRDEYLVVRHHPYIDGGKDNLSEMDFIARASLQALSAPTNVRIVMPSEQLTSYALLWHTDAAITFFSTIAVEAAARGVPTAALEISMYAKALRHIIKEHDTASLQKIINDLLSESAQSNVEDLRRLYRFSHAFFLKFSVKFRSFTAKGLKIENTAELVPGRDPVLDRVCDRIINGSSLEVLPSSEDYNRSTIEEWEFFQKEIVEIRDFRQKVREETSKQQRLGLNPKIGVIYLIYKEDSTELLEKWIRRSRYENIGVHYCTNVDWENYQNTINGLLEIIENSQEDYIIVTNTFSQYDESLLLSAMEILLAEANQKNQGVLFGGFQAFYESMNYAERLYKQQIFTQRNPALTFDMAVESLPVLEYSLTMLSFCLLRKPVVVEILKAVRELPTATQAAEKLFTLINSDRIHRMELPMMVIHKNKEILRSHLLRELKEELKLRAINLIVFPDWNQPEESVLQDLASVVRALASHCERDSITLLVDTSNISQEDAELALSSVALNLMMEEDLDVTAGPEISLVGNLGEMQWAALLTRVSGRIALDNENKQAIALAKAENLPLRDLDNM